MMQQINLYQVDQAPEPVSFTYLQLVQATLCLLLVLSLLSIGYVINCLYTKQQANILAEQQLRLTAEVAHLKAALPQKEEQDQLILQIKNLEQMAARLQNMQHTLNNLQATEKNGFAAYLAALANHKVAELWLTEIKVSAAAQTIYLAGKTTNAENIPKLLQQLSLDPSFAGKTFATFKLHSEPKEKCISFSIGASQ